MLKKSVQVVTYLVFLLVFCLVLFLSTPLYDKPLLRIKIINLWKRFQLSELPMLNEILTEKYTIERVQYNYDLILDGVAGKRKQTLDPNPKIIKIFYTGEAVRPNIENYDLSIGFDYIDDPKYMRIPYYYMRYGKKINADYRRGKCNPNHKQFACFLVSNAGGNNLGMTEGCTARNRIFHKLSEYKTVQSGGKFLNNQPRRVPNTETAEWLSQCKFVIAYENTSYPGYITEKPFQAYFAGAIPIYYGHSSVFTEINKQALIYAGDFKTEDQLLENIKNIDQDDHLYCQIWNQPLMNNKELDYDQIKQKLAAKLYDIIRVKLLIKE